jgi:hypothetical protein
MNEDDAFIARILGMSDKEMLAGMTDADIERMRRSHERSMCLALATNLRREAAVQRIMATALRGAGRSGSAGAADPAKQ